MASGQVWRCCKSRCEALWVGRRGHHVGAGMRERLDRVEPACPPIGPPARSPTARPRVRPPGGPPVRPNRPLAPPTRPPLRHCHRQRCISVVATRLGWGDDDHPGTADGKYSSPSRSYPLPPVQCRAARQAALAMADDAYICRHQGLWVGRRGFPGYRMRKIFFPITTRPRTPKFNVVVPHRGSPEEETCRRTWALNFEIRGEGLCSFVPGEEYFPPTVSFGVLRVDASSVQDLPCNILRGSGGSAIGARNKHFIAMSWLR